MLGRAYFTLALCLFAVVASPALSNTAVSARSLHRAVVSNDIAGAKQMIMAAIQSGEIDNIINVPDAAGRSMLHSAVIASNWEMMDLLLLAGAEPEPLDNFDRTPFSYASESLRVAMELNQLRDDAERPEEKTSKNPLRRFVEKFSRAVAEWGEFVEEEVATEEKVETAEGRRARELKSAVNRLARASVGAMLPIERLQAAVLHQENVQLLVDKDVELQALLWHEDLTPLLQDEKTRALLVEVGSMNIVGNIKVAKPPDDFNETITLLTRAIGRRDVDFAQSMVAAGADVNNFVNHLGYTLVQLAAESRNPAMVKVLLDGGADPDGGDYRSALMRAAERGDLDSVQLLINAGANVVRADNVHSETALLIAAKQKHAKVVAALIAGGAKASDEEIDEQIKSVNYSYDFSLDNIKATIDAAKQLLAQSSE